MYVHLLVHKYIVNAVCLISLVRFLFVVWNKSFVLILKF